MTESRRGRPGPDWTDRDARPDEEPSAEFVERMVTAGRRSAGRPSLTGRGVRTPTMNVRMPADLRDRLDTVAREHHVSTSQVIREAVEEYLARR